MNPYYHLRQYLLLFLLGFLSSNVIAQQNFENNYRLLESQAPIPASILTSSLTKTEVDLDNLPKEEKVPFGTKKKKEFLLEANYLIDNLLTSHLLLFNTPLNEMIDQIAAKLLVEQPDLLADVHFYIVKSSSVNAFATDRGDIFITMGLLARVKTEAELAFIIAHELVHYREKHSMEAFVKKEQLKKESKKSARKMINTLLKESHFSKDRELEADKEGLALFAQAGYAFNDAERVFDILELSHSQTFNIPIEKDIFETQYIQIDTADWNTTIESIVPRKQNSKRSKKYSSHPDIDKRRDYLDENRTYYTSKDRASFVTTTKSQFANFVTMAQMEILEILLLENQYEAAIYHAAVLQQKYLDNLFLKEKMAYAFYVFAQYTLSEEVEDTYSKKHFEGEWFRFFHLLHELSAKEVSSIAAVYCWELALANPNNEQIQLIAQDLLEDIVIFEIEDPLTYFAKAPIDTSILNSTKSFARFAFADYMHDDNFTKHLKKGIEYRAKKIEQEEIDYAKTTKQKKKEEKKKKIKGIQVGVPKVVMVNPFYLHSDIHYKRGASVDYIKTEEAQNQLATDITTIADKVDLETEIINRERLDANNIELLRDIHHIESWSDQFFSHSTYVVALNHNQTIDITQKYGTNYFGHTGFLFLSKRNRPNFAYVPMTVAIYLFPPHFSLAMWLAKSNNLFYYCYVLDVATYKLVLKDQNYINAKSHSLLLKNHLYWSLEQLKGDKK